MNAEVTDICCIKQSPIIACGAKRTNVNIPQSLLLLLKLFQLHQPIWLPSSLDAMILILLRELFLQMIEACDSVGGISIRSLGSLLE